MSAYGDQQIPGAVALTQETNKPAEPLSSDSAEALRQLIAQGKHPQPGTEVPMDAASSMLGHDPAPAPSPSPTPPPSTLELIHQNSKEATDALMRGDMGAWIAKINNGISNIHTPDVPRFEDLSVPAIQPAQADVDKAASWKNKPISSPEELSQFEQDSANAQPQTGTDLATKNYHAATVIGTEIQNAAHELVGDHAQVKYFREAANEAWNHFTDAYAHVQYGKTPSEVAALQEQAKSADSSLRADANRQLKEAQENAANPGDPARLWHNMDNYHQAMFLTGNAMSQLGLALMHVNGPTPMDQLNHLMDLDFQHQKLKFEAKHEMLREAGNAYSFAAKRFDDEISREAMAKNMMFESMRLSHESLGQVLQAQNIQLEQKKNANMVQQQIFQDKMERATAQLHAVTTQMTLMAPYLRQQAISIPEPARNKFNGIITSINILGRAEKELKGTGVTPEAFTPYGNDKRSMATELAAADTGTSNPSKDAVDAKEDILRVPKFGMKGGTINTLHTNQAQKINEGLQQLEEFRRMRVNQSEIDALAAQLQHALDSSSNETKRALLELTGLAGGKEAEKYKVK